MELKQVFDEYETLLTSRLFAFPELHDGLEEVGFQEVRGLDERGEPDALAARRMIVTAVKPAM